MNPEMHPNLNEPDIQPAANAQEKDITTLATGAGVSLVGKFSGRIFLAGGQVALARLFGPELFGLYALGWTILRLIGPLAPLGLDRGIIKFASEHWQKDENKFKGILVSSLGYALLSGLVIAVLIYMLAVPLENLFQSPGLAAVLKFIAAAFPLFSTMRVLVSATQITQRMKYSIYAEDLAQPVVNFLLIGLFFVLGWGLLGAVGATVISFAAAMVLAAYYTVKLFPNLSSAKLEMPVSSKALLAFSLPTAFAGIFTMLTTWTDRLFIGYYRSEADVGIYQALSQSSLLFSIILRALTTIFTPMIADLYQQNEHARLNELYKVSTKWGVYCSVPLFLLLVFVPKEVMSVVFGAAYVSGAKPLFILAIGQLINVSTGSVGFILMMTGREKHWLVLSAATFVLGIALNYWLVPLFGLVGSAISTATVISLLYVGGLIVVFFTTRLWPYDRRYLKGIAATITAVIVLLLTKPIMPNNDLVRLLITGLLATGLFGITLYQLGVDEEDKEFINILLAKLRKK